MYDQMIEKPANYLNTSTSLKLEAERTEQYLGSLRYFASTHHKTEGDSAQVIVDYITKNMENFVSKKALVESETRVRSKTRRK